MASIDALATVYGDARFVMSHRDVAAVIPSLCALKEALTSPLTSHMDTTELGRREADVWHEALSRTLAFRDDGNESRFFDVAFARMQDSPLEAVAELYAAMGDELSAAARLRMEQWWEASSSSRQRSSARAPATYGLDEAALRDRFGFYNRRFVADGGG